MLDFRVETFLCVCKHLSYTKAANELAITQPAVSGHIKFLEEYYQVKLFNYENKHLILTKEGKVLKDAFQTMSLDIGHLKNDLPQLDKSISLNIGATKSIGDFVLVKKLPQFIKTHSDTNINICVDDTKNLFEMLDDGKLDFFFCEGIINKHDYSYRSLINEVMRPVCSCDYELPAIEGIESLFNEKLILRESGSGTRNILEDALREKGFDVTSFRNIYTVNSPAMILELVRQGCGFTFIFDSVCHNDIENCILKEISIPMFTINHEFNAVWKKGSLYDKQISAYIKELI